MSAPELPDDPARWPQNPYDLLGVRPGVAAKDVRRAYARLIRTYKPEQHPEQFRRIREAYEAVLQHLEWFGFMQAQQEPPETEPPGEPISTRPTAAPSTEEAAGAPAAEPTRPRSPQEMIHEAWQQAVAGDAAAAYQRLTGLRAANPTVEAVYAPLYWLLALAPELDPGCSPRDWLVDGLLATGLSGRLRELYRREVADDPSEALGTRFERLLASPGPAAVLADLLEGRWQVAGRLQDWRVIRLDVDAQRGRFLREDEDLWSRLLLAAVDQLAWGDDEAGRRWRAITKSWSATRPCTAATGPGSTASISSSASRRAGGSSGRGGWRPPPSWT
jgi:DnaJ domain